MAFSSTALATVTIIVSVLLLAALIATTLNVHHLVFSPPAGVQQRNRLFLLSGFISALATLI